ncbi:enoyl-CoA hydratase-related protein [Kitasatospora viridis]|uniref:Enoyl-CoA hydratase/carnithine racemase n=1 Tax=Kitasatospora viridis TaxID=281105 RepID=A0A561UI63_9ACTN|nr:enoyl-CoA hydratase-related protein [Kitasatospora viridis]TWF99037.1 enoyl-CoA hydratase/carnithine racemase [Kitasatospora viridis]
MPALVLTSTDGPVTTLTLNRPEKLNALSYALIDALDAALDRAEADDTVRAVIGDLATSIAGGPARALREVVRRGHGITRRIENFPKPLIAAVNGLAYDGGCELAEAAPLALAANTARFAKPEIGLGFPLPFGGSQRLPRHLGRKRALEPILTGDPIDAHRAAALGLNLPIDEALATEATLFAATIPATGVHQGVANFLSRHQ